jgi:hypothetical protein
MKLCGWLANLSLLRSSRQLPAAGGYVYASSLADGAGDWLIQDDSLEGVDAGGSHLHGR